MGAVLAKFRKEKSPADILERLETDIRTIEEFSLSTQEKQKRLVGNFLVISIGLYAVVFLVFYFVFFPPTWPERITYSVPLLMFPLIIFLLRRLLAWYFQRKINKNSTKLITLRAEKKKILEEVMEKETYNVASKLLSKYGDKTYGIRSLAVTAPTPQANRLPADNRIQNLNTSLVARPTVEQSYSQMKMNPLALSANNGQAPLTPRSPITTSTGGVLRHRTGPNQFMGSGVVALQNPRPYPIINQKTQGILEKMVDYLIGDGPQNRYALICKECFAHNGMAREEEFEYATFRCAFCNTLNPSRKLRPVAPKLPSGYGSPNALMVPSSSTNSPSESSESSDEEELPRRTDNVVVLRPADTKTQDPVDVRLKENKYNNCYSSEAPSEETMSEGGKISNDGDEAMPKSTETEAAAEPIKESETKQ